MLRHPPGPFSLNEAPGSNAGQMKMYALNAVNRSGNVYEICQGGFIECIGVMKEKKANTDPRDFVLFIVNRDRVDFGCPDGLSNEEREMLP